MSYWCNIIRHISTYVHTHRWKDSLFENAFVCVMVFLFEIQKTSVLFKAFFCSDSAIFFPFVWNFWKHFFDIWSWQNTCVRIEYSKASTILESNWLQFFCITECSKFQITYQCTQKKKMACTQSIYECHGQYSCNGDQQNKKKKLQTTEGNR